MYKGLKLLYMNKNIKPGKLNTNIWALAWSQILESGKIKCYLLNRYFENLHNKEPKEKTVSLTRAEFKKTFPDALVLPQRIMNKIIKQKYGIQNGAN